MLVVLRHSDSKFIAPNESCHPRGKRWNAISPKYMLPVPWHEGRSLTHPRTSYMHTRNKWQCKQNSGWWMPAPGPNLLCLHILQLHSNLILNISKLAFGLSIIGLVASSQHNQTSMSVVRLCPRVLLSSKAMQYNLNSDHTHCRQYIWWSPVWDKVAYLLESTWYLRKKKKNRSWNSVSNKRATVLCTLLMRWGMSD